MVNNAPSAAKTQESDLSSVTTLHFRLRQRQTKLKSLS